MKRTSRAKEKEFEASIHPDILEIKKIALTFNPSELEMDNLVKAVLADPKARALIPDFSTFGPEDLKKVDLPDTVTSSVKDSAWPKALTLNDEDDENLGYDHEAFAGLGGFIRKLWLKTMNKEWAKSALAHTYQELIDNIDHALARIADELPAQLEPAQRLAQLIIQEAVLPGESGPGRRRDPIFLFSHPGQGSTTMLRIFAQSLQARYLSASAELTSTGDMVSKLEDKGPSLVEVHGFLTGMSEGGFLQSSLSYFANGTASVNSTGGKSFADLGDSHDDTDLTAVMQRNIFIYHLLPPVSPGELHLYSAEELRALMQTQHQAMQESQIIVPQIPAEYWMLIRNANSVLMKRTGTSWILKQITRELERNLHELANIPGGRQFHVPEPDRLAALLLLAHGYPSPREVEGEARRFLFQCDRALRSSALKTASEAEITIPPLNGDTPSVLQEAVDPSRMPEWMERVEAVSQQLSFSGCRLTYRLKVHDHPPRLEIERVKIRQPRAVAGGRFMTFRPKTRLADVIGHSEAKKRFQTIMNYLKQPELFNRYKAVPPTRILLSGPPGTGKTLLAKAVAGEYGLPFFAVSAAEITSQKFAGYGASLLRETFTVMASCRPCMLFLDEVDAFMHRETIGDGSVGYDGRSILNTLLTLMDGLETEHDIVIIGATNRPQDIDDALLRPGRFGTQIKVGSLTAPERAALIRLHLEPDLCPDQYEHLVEYIVRRTIGSRSAADLVNIVNEAKLLAIEKHENISAPILSEAIDQVLLGHKIKPLAPHLRRSVALHEAAHAMTCRLTNPDQKIDRVSIGQREDTLGLVRLTGNDEHEIRIISRKEWMADLLVMLAGPMAEQMEYGEWNMGASSDFDKAVMLARYAVQDLGVEMGMEGIVLGRIAESDVVGKTPLPLVRAVSRILRRAQAEVLALLNQHRDLLHRIADELEQVEDLHQDDLDRIMGDAAIDRESIFKRLLKPANGENKVADTAEAGMVDTH